MAVNQKEQFPQISSRNSREDKIFARQIIF